MTCDVCGHLNGSERSPCEEYDSYLPDSPDWGVYDNLNFDVTNDLVYRFG